MRAARLSRLQCEELLCHQQLRVWGRKLTQCLVRGPAGHNLGGKLSYAATRDRKKGGLAEKGQLDPKDFRSPPPV